jgi:CxxC motif-containing protein (DUF1111 family)
MDRKTALLTLVALVLWCGVSDARPRRSHGHRPDISGFGTPLYSLTPGDLATFSDAQADFEQVDELTRLGPIFNSRSCGACHFQPALGGSGAFINEVRVRANPAGPLHIFAVDNMLRGGSQTQAGAIVFAEGLRGSPIGCQITSPSCQPSTCQQEELNRTKFATSLPICDPTSSSFVGGANCAAERQTPPLFGLGLVEALSDQTLTNLAHNEPASVRGVTRTVTEFGHQRIGRFGFKDDIASLRTFSGGAYLNEIGITNPDNPTEVSNCALGVSQSGVLLQVPVAPEDVPDSDGFADVDRFADFIRVLNPPPTLKFSSAAWEGRRLFSRIGCEGCHTGTLTTDANPASFIPPTTGGVPITSSVNKALAKREIHPYSDFLLHDMGSLGDGMVAGSAGPTTLRTTALWGVRVKLGLLHDGRADDIPTAISLHDGQGKAASLAYQALTQPEQDEIVEFLNSI